MIKIALDAMGGDFAPEEIVKGALQALKENTDIEIILVGQQEKIQKLLQKYHAVNRISSVQAAQVIGMDETPVQAVREKKDASINVALKLLKDKKAQALVSAGNTGAFMAASLFKLGRIPGVERPAIATVFPTGESIVLLLDMGANVDNKPKHLLQFGEMGSLYAEHVLHIQNPRVGLLNIGEEKEKGNELTQASWDLLSKANLNFIGNVESKEVLAGKVDVVVCDGFVGNLMLKFAESVAVTVFNLLKQQISKSFLAKIGALFLYPSFKSLRKKIDYDEYGGAPILGVNGICIKAHGRARAKAIKNAIRVAWEAAREDMVGCIKAVEGR